MLSSCAQSIIQYDTSNDDTLSKYKCLKTKYNSLLIQEISYCYGPIYTEQKRMWSLRYYGQKHVNYLLEEKERYENRKPPEGIICANPNNYSYTDVVILPKGTQIFIEKLWTREANWIIGESIGFIGKLKRKDSEFIFRFSEAQLLTFNTDGQETYNNYETQMYYQYWPYRDEKLKKLELVSSRKVSVKEYLDELYDRCD